VNRTSAGGWLTMKSVHFRKSCEKMPIFSENVAPGVETDGS
jgi:hypothetical protein